MRAAVCALIGAASVAHSATITYSAMWKATDPMPNPALQAQYPASGAVPIRNAQSGLLWVQPRQLVSCQKLVTSTSMWQNSSLSPTLCAAQLDKFATSDTSVVAVANSEFAIAGTAPSGDSRHLGGILNPCVILGARRRRRALFLLLLLSPANRTTLQCRSALVLATSLFSRKETAP